jgi:hypothetical protein
LHVVGEKQEQIKKIAQEVGYLWMNQQWLICVHNTQNLWFN